MDGAACRAENPGVMKTRHRNDREDALIASALREAAVAKAKRTGNFVSNAVPTTPMDAPTIMGWDNPAAALALDVSAEKWARIAALMDAERNEGRERRRITRRNVMLCLGGMLGLAALYGARLFLIH